MKNKCRQRSEGPPVVGFVVLVEDREMESEEDVMVVFNRLMHIKGAFFCRELTDNEEGSEKLYAACKNSDEVGLLFISRGMEKIKRRLQADGVSIEMIPVESPE